MQGQRAATRIATVVVAVVALLAAGAAGVSSWIWRTYAQRDGAAALLALLRRLFPSQSFGYLGTLANIDKLLAGTTFMVPIAWLALLFTLVLFRPLVRVLATLVDDLLVLPSQLRADAAAARRRFLRVDRSVLLTFAAVAAVGTFMRVRYVGVDMNGDELMKFFESSYHGPFVTAAVFGQEPWHTYSNELMYLGWKILGLNHWGIRWHSVVAGSLLILMTFVWATYFFDEYVAVIGAALVSGSAVLIAYSVYGRNYIHIPLLGMCVLLLVHRGAWRARYGYLYLAAVLTALGFYGLPSMIVFFAGALVLLAARFAAARRSRVAVPPRVYLAYPVLTALLTAALFAPFLVISGYAEFMNKLVARNDAGPLSAIARQVPQSLDVYRQLFPEWRVGWMWPALVVGGVVLSAAERWHRREALIGVLAAAAGAGLLGLSFAITRMHTFAIPFASVAAGLVAVRARRTPAFAASVAVIVFAVGIAYAASAENIFGTTAEERVFGVRKDQLIVPNAQGVEALVAELRAGGRLRPGVLVDSDDLTFRYPILFALLEQGYADSDHFSLWRNRRDATAIYQMYGRSTTVPESIEYAGARFRRGSVFMMFPRSIAVEFTRVE